jgi:hypothetical protein
MEARILKLSPYYPSVRRMALAPPSVSAIPTLRIHANGIVEEVYDDDPSTPEEDAEFHAMVEASIIDHTVDRGDECEPRYRAWVIRAHTPHEIARMHTVAAILPKLTIPAQYECSPESATHIFAHPTSKRLLHRARVVKHPMPPPVLDLRRDDHYALYLRQQSYDERPMEPG